MFLAHIELHHATSSDYHDLHAHMSHAGFKRRITADGTGETYDLTPATYWLSGTHTYSEVLRMARQAAEKVGRRYAAIVMQGDVITWCGLDEAQTLKSLLRVGA